MPSPTRCITTRDVRRFVDEHVFGSTPGEHPVTHGRVGIELECVTRAHGGAPVATIDEMAARRRGVAPRRQPAHLRARRPARAERTRAPGPRPRRRGHGRRRRAPPCHALAPLGIDLVGIGLDPAGPRPRVLDAGRYAAMEAYFDTRWPAGRTMMRNTAVGPGEPRSRRPPPTSSARWRRAHDLAPGARGRLRQLAVRRLGHADGLALDAARGLEPDRPTPHRDRSRARRGQRGHVVDSLRARRARDAHPHRRRRSACRRCARSPSPRWIDDGHELGWPTLDDLAYHLTTLFPPVRPRGWLELRMHRRAARRVVAGRGRGHDRAARRSRGRRRRVRAVAPALREPLARRGARTGCTTRRIGGRRRAVLRGRAPGARPARRRRRDRSPRPRRTTTASWRAAAAPPTTSTPTRAAWRSRERRRARDHDAASTTCRGRSTRSTDARAPDASRSSTPVPDDRPAAAGLAAHVAVVLGPRAHRPLRGALAAPRARRRARRPTRATTTCTTRSSTRAASGRRSPILDAAERARASSPTSASAALDVLDAASTLGHDADDPLLADGFVYGMVVQHEHQHDETHARHPPAHGRLRAPRRRRPAAPPTPPGAPLRRDVLVARRHRS